MGSRRRASASSMSLNRRDSPRRRGARRRSSPARLGVGRADMLQFYRAASSHRRSALTGWSGARTAPGSRACRAVVRRPGRRSPASRLLHGYGADEARPVRARPYLPDGCVVAAPRPLAAALAGAGYSWYPIEGVESRDPRTSPSRHPLCCRGSTTRRRPRRSASSVLAGGGRPLTDAAPEIRSRRLRRQSQRLRDTRRSARDSKLADIRPPVFWGRGTRR